MKVILLENLAKIGSIGEIIDVKRGFARNYLISNKKALYASKQNIKEVEKIKSELNKKDQEKKKQAKARNKKLNDALAAAEEDAGAASDRAEELNRQSDFAADSAASAGDRMDQYYDSEGNFSDARANEAAMAAARAVESADEGLSGQQLRIAQHKAI